MITSAPQIVFVQVTHTPTPIVCTLRVLALHSQMRG